MRSHLPPSPILRLIFPPSYAVRCRPLSLAARRRRRRRWRDLFRPLLPSPPSSLVRRRLQFVDLCRRLKKRNSRISGRSTSQVQRIIVLKMISESDFVANYKTLAAPIKSSVDKFALLPAFLKVRGLVKQQIDSFNYFINHGIHKILKANSRLECSHDPTYYLDYVSPIFVDIEYTKGNQANKVIEKRNNILIGNMPIMLRSSHCVLSGKDEVELAKLGECPLDPGGYFVVKGTEKVIIIQEQLSKNRIIICMDGKGRLTASVTSSTSTWKSKTVFIMKKDKIYLMHNNFSKEIPIMIIMRAMGIESDQEVVQMLGRDPRYGNLLLPSIQECSAMGIYTQQQALNHLDGLAKSDRSKQFGTEQEGKAICVLRYLFLAHVPVVSENFRPKCIYSAVMLRRMMDAILNPNAMDDKDYVGNKRFELSGQLISLLFEDLFKQTNKDAISYFDGQYERCNRSMPLDFSQCIRMSNKITVGLEYAISSGNWIIQRFHMHRTGVSQVLSRLSYIGVLGQMTRISPQFEKSRKVSGPRALQPSQWGMLCPCDTPEGEGCGLTKNLALLTHVTTDEEEGPLTSLVCFNLKYGLILN